MSNKTIETEIIINANVSQVWNVLTSFAEFPSWNPFIKEIKGDLIVGGTLHNVLVNKGKEYPFTPVITKVTKEKEFAWMGKALANTFNGNHYFKLETISENQTRLIHGEKFSGLLSSLLLLLIGSDTEKGFHAMNGALKERIEKAA